MTFPFSYQVIRSDRRTLGIEIKAGAVLVRAPRFVTQKQIEDVLAEKQAWIEKHLTQSVQKQEQTQPTEPPLTQEELQTLGQQAVEAIPPLVAKYAKLLGVTYGRITIRAQHTRWGSCSSKGNLNFNCLLMLAPPEVLESVVVHELCHRIEMNHGPRFYAAVYRVFPEYDKCNRWLKAHGAALQARMNELRGEGSMKN
ncbi:MAG: M48 family metallopeptidase [Clostridia bacterium]|nr:M48 family metallopeptidase [Clostridia bacterium]